MIVSIITPSLNCGDVLERNLKSVAAQGMDASQLEQWVIDGGSSDGTLAVLKEYSDVKWISEPDRGLSHAVNKGIERAKGKWIWWLNADDSLEPGAVNEFLEFANRHESKMFSGDLKFLGYDGELIGSVSGRPYTFEDLTEEKFDINQPSMLAHRDVYEEVGGLDETYPFAMDYEWTVRAVRQYQCVHIPRPLARYSFREGSLMDANMAAHYRAVARVRRRYGLSRLSRADMRIFMFLATDPLRRMRGLRRSVRALKRLWGIQMPLAGEH